jgi:hypothetical protein
MAEFASAGLYYLRCLAMVFAYYSRLSAAQKRIYRKSDGMHAVPLPREQELHPLISRLSASLGAEDREAVEQLCREIADGISSRLGVPSLRIKVLAVRPSASWGELHGLYEPVRGSAGSVITLWMRTAKQKRVVAFRAFLRTLLHELCHHLDYELYKLPDSFHTEGFYKRESSLFHQLAPEEEQPAGAGK